MRGVTFDVSVPRYLLAKSAGRVNDAFLFGAASGVATKYLARADSLAADPGRGRTPNAIPPAAARRPSPETQKPPGSGGFRQVTTLRAAYFSSVKYQSFWSRFVIMGIL